MVRSDAWVVAASWLYKVPATQLRKVHLNLKNGPENRAKIYRDLQLCKEEIRLVTILPGEGCSVIKCLLHHAALGPSIPTYDALSYTWGPSYSVCSITLNGSPFHVTRGLEAVLRRLRLPNTTRRLWVDAICINQNDEDERGEQVRLMREIYTHAKEVIIWLGDSSDDSDTAMEFLTLASGMSDMKEWLKQSIKQTAEGSFKREWRAIFLMLGRNYWKRVWIVQEIACATKLRVLCGLWSVPWEAITTCQLAWCEVAQDPATGALQEIMNSIQMGKKSNRILSKSIGDSGPLQLEKNRIAVQDTTTSRLLVSLMCNHWAAEATDERDRIYALAGIASDCKLPALPVDYSIQTWKVYLQTMKFLLHNTGRLDMIAYSGVGRDNYISGRPTWSPSFYFVNTAGYRSMSSRHLLGVGGSHAFAASRDSLANARFIERYRKFDKILGIDRTTLQVECCCVDVISQRLLYQGKYWFKWKLGVSPKIVQKYATNSSAWIQNGYRRKEIDIIKVLYSFVLETPSRSLRNRSEYSTQEERREEFWRTLTHNRTLDGCVAPEEWSEAFSVLINGPASVSIGLTPGTPHDLGAEHAMSLISPFLEATERLIGSGRWLFMTKTGRLGVANKSAAVGDQICVVPGCYMPIIIRIEPGKPKGDYPSGTTHGGAYLHGYMSGKAMDDLNAERLNLRTFMLS